MRAAQFRCALLCVACAFLAGARATAADLTVTLPSVSSSPGGLVDIPIVVSASPAGRGIVSIDFRLTLDPAVAFGSNSKPDGFLQTWGSAFTNGTASFLAAAAAGATPVATSGTLLNTVQVRLRPNAVAGTDMPLVFDHLLFNEGTPSVAVVPGVLHVVAPPASAPAPGTRAFAFALDSPNPVRGTASFACTVPGGEARLAIHGVDGRLVRALVVPASFAGGTVRWDLRDARGARVPPGVYLARLAHDSRSLACRMVVLD
jgi:hypothetical protein